LEDLSLICYAGNITELKGIFDTQIAHRMCYEDENNCNSIGTKHNSLSLNEMLKNNFDVDCNVKDEVHELMSKSPYLWKTRPISYKLNYYAGSDVYYLPKMYDLIVQKCETKIVKKITLKNIFEECEKYLQYLKINKNIKNYNKMNLPKGTKIKGLIKNFQHHCIYAQLNIGYIGIVDIYSSVQYLIQKYKLGDIIDFTIINIDNKRKRMMLDITNKENENEVKEKLEDEKINIEQKINFGNDGINFNVQKNNGTINKNNNGDINFLVQGININKEGFYPKSYIQNLKNGINYNNNNPYNNYHNLNYDINRENYYQENENKKIYQYNNMMPNNNYNGLFYNDKENSYYYDTVNDNNNDNEDVNSDSYYYTLKPFPK